MKSLGKNYSQMTIYSNNILSQPKAGVLWLVSSKEPLSHKTQRKCLYRSLASNALEIIHYFSYSCIQCQGFLSLKSLLDFNSVTFVKQCAKKTPDSAGPHVHLGLILINLSSTYIRFSDTWFCFSTFPNKFCLLRQIFLQISP